MKKTLLIAAAALVSASAFAQTVTSANVVGYSKVELIPGYTVIHVPFSEGTNSLDIQDVLSTSNLTQAASSTSSDKILFWDNVGLKYDTYWLSNGAEGKGTNPDKVGKWIDGATGLVASNSVAPGIGFFFQRAGTTSVTNMFSGDVVIAETGTNSITLLEGFSVVASPFSSEFGLNTSVTNWVAQGSIAAASSTSSDKILFWDNVGLKYDTYWLSNGAEGKGTNPDKVGKWIDGATGLIASNSVPLNSAFFYQRVSAPTLTIEIEQPYTLD